MLSTFAPALRAMRRAAAAGGLLALLAVPGQAFQVVPITQDFEPSGRGAKQVFQVENDRDEPVTVTIAMAKRIVDIDGRETLGETDDFTVFPTEIILQPKTSRAVRVQWIGDPAPAAELAYRIIAEETPLNMRRETPGASVFLTVRYIGSIYIVPKRARHDVVVASAGPAGPAQLEVVIENRGTLHAILDAPSLTVTAGGVTKTVDAEALNAVLNGENILAGAKRRIVLPWPPGLPAGPVSANLAYSAL
ncbi:hypothetical protein [Thalassobaculum sp.]|uniref:hypothetical protein n=1 Tax=Thalassobaculum sp. TaxID=2022740 RepID=UPI0032EDBD0D